MSRKIIVITMVLLLFGLSTTANAAHEEDGDYTGIADFLYDIGLFKGTNNGYQLNLESNREQAAVMMVRLLGKEEEARLINYTHSFTDVQDWASPYIGYLWKNGLTKGVNAEQTLYGSKQPITGAQFMTYILRSLRYDDSQGDFSWNTSLKTALDLGILTDVQYQKYQTMKAILRDDLVLLSYKGLGSDLKESDISMLKNHIEEGIIPENAMASYPLAYYKKVDTTHPIKNKDDLERAFISNIIGFQTSDDYTLDYRDIPDPDKILGDAFKIFQKLPGYSAIFSGYRWEWYDDDFNIKYTYRITTDQLEEALTAANTLVNNMDPSLTDYQKALYLHDYVVHQTDYVKTPNDDYDQTIYGVMVNGEAVCEGYSDAYFYLTALSGIEGELVYGDAGGELHSWNTINLDGSYYMVDPTWDDPRSGSDYVEYAYFNVTNEVLSQDHNWTESEYPISTDTSYNYYVYNNLVVSDINALTNRIQQGINNRVTEITLKIQGGFTESQMDAALDTLYNYSNFDYWTYEDMGIISIKNITY